MFPLNLVLVAVPKDVVGAEKASEQGHSRTLQA